MPGFPHPRFVSAISTGWGVVRSPIFKLSHPLWTLELVACCRAAGWDRLQSAQSAALICVESTVGAEFRHGLSLT